MALDAIHDVGKMLERWGLRGGINRKRVTLRSKLALAYIWVLRSYVVRPNASEVQAAFRRSHLGRWASLEPKKTMHVGAAATLPFIPKPIILARKLSRQDNLEKELKTPVKMPTNNSRIVF